MIALLSALLVTRSELNRPAYTCTYACTYTRMHDGAPAVTSVLHVDG